MTLMAVLVIEGDHKLLRSPWKTPCGLVFQLLLGIWGWGEFFKQVSFQQIPFLLMLLKHYNQINLKTKLGFLVCSIIWPCAHTTYLIVKLNFHLLVKKKKQPFLFFLRTMEMTHLRSQNLSKVSALGSVMLFPLLYYFNYLQVSFSFIYFTRSILVVLLIHQHQQLSIQLSKMF